MSLIKGARHLDEAKKFYDWALTAPAQKSGGADRQLPDPVEPGDAGAAGGPDLSKIKLIEYDFATYGSVGHAHAIARRAGPAK